MKIVFKRDTPERWAQLNPVLRANEIGREVPSGRFKVGNGVDRWIDLPYSTTLPEAAIMAVLPKSRGDGVMDGLSRLFSRGVKP